MRSFIPVMETRRKIWEGHVSRIEENRNAYRDLVGNLERKNPFGRTRHRLDGNIKKMLRKWTIFSYLIAGTSGGL